MDYFRNIHDDEEWLNVLSTIAQIEKTDQQITFVGEDGERWGYRGYPDGRKVKLIQGDWIEEEVK